MYTSVFILKMENSTQIERWLPVVEYEGYYEVSDAGRIKRLANARVNGWKEKIKTNILGTRGYMGVLLSKNGKRKKFTIHRLVAIAFLGPSNLQVDHIDGDKLNNNLLNLRYLNGRDNVSAAFLRGKKTSKYTGVSRTGGRWQAAIKEKGIDYYLGKFISEEDAAAAYIKAKNLLIKNAASDPTLKTA